MGMKSLPDPASKTGLGTAGAQEEIVVSIRSDLDIVAARQRGRTLAESLGFGPSDSTLVATAISELARNILVYAQCGEVRLALVENSGKRGLMIIAADQGPGIPDLRLALQDGFSTSRSLGLGLPGVRRLMDEFEIQSSVGRGTRVVVKKWLANSR